MSVQWEEFDSPQQPAQTDEYRRAAHAGLLLAEERCPICGKRLQPQDWVRPIVTCSHGCQQHVTRLPRGLKDALLSLVAHHRFEVFVGRLLADRCAVCERACSRTSCTCRRWDCERMWGSLGREENLAVVAEARHRIGLGS